MVYNLLKNLKPTALCNNFKYTSTRSILTKPHYNFKEFKERADELNKSIVDRNLNKDISVDELISKYTAYGKLQYEVNALREKQNKLSMGLKGLDKEQKVLAIENAKSNKVALTKAEASLESLETEVFHLASYLPNFTHPDTPIGDESQATIISTNNVREEYLNTKDHLELALTNNMLNLEAAAKVSGSSFYYLINSGALLELALVQLAISMAQKNGFKPILTPDLVKPEIVERCGFSPRDPNLNQNFNVTTNSNNKGGKPELNLVATAEIPMAAYHLDKILNRNNLPDKYVAFGHSFRAEAGARGKETRGIYRVHQFSKVELFAFSTPETSQDLLNEILEFQIQFFDALKLHYRVLNMPTQELGSSAYCKYDIEAWLPSQSKWGEISSTSNCTDYQSRRLNIRMPKKVKGSTQDNFVHTINGTACAVPRTIVAILEQYQTSDGKVRIPDVLRSYFGNREFF